MNGKNAESLISKIHLLRNSNLKITKKISILISSKQKFFLEFKNLQKEEKKLNLEISKTKKILIKNCEKNFKINLKKIEILKNFKKNLKYYQNLKIELKGKKFKYNSLKLYTQEKENGNIQGNETGSGEKKILNFIPESLHSDNILGLINRKESAKDNWKGRRWKKKGKREFEKNLEKWEARDVEAWLFEIGLLDQFFRPVLIQWKIDNFLKLKDAKFLKWLLSESDVKKRKRSGSLIYLNQKRKSKVLGDSYCEISKIKKKLFILNLDYLDYSWKNTKNSKKRNDNDDFSNNLSHFYFYKEFNKICQVLSKFEGFTDIDNNVDILNFVTTMNDKKKIEEIIRNQSEIKIKISIVILKNFSFKHIKDILKYKFSNLNNIYKNKEYITGILLGDWGLFFLKNSLIIPLLVEEDQTNDWGFYDFKKMALKIFERKIEQVSKTITNWNKKDVYNQQNNCYNFVQEILKNLGIEEKFDDSIQKYFSEIKKNSKINHIPLYFRKIVNWNELEVLKWLELIQYDKYLSEEFKINNIDGLKLIKMKYDDKIITKKIPKDYLKKFLVLLCNIKKTASSRENKKFNQGLVVVCNKFFKDGEQFEETKIEDIEKYSTIFSDKKLLRDNYFEFDQTLLDEIRITKKVKVKIIITETNEGNSTLRTLVSRLLDIFYFKSSDFGLFHTGKKKLKSYNQQLF